MQVQKHKSEGVWFRGEYNFYVENRLVAKLRRQLIGNDYAYLYFLPEIYRDDDRTRINLRYMTDGR